MHRLSFNILTFCVVSMCLTVSQNVILQELANMSLIPRGWVVKINDENNQCGSPGE